MVKEAAKTQGFDMDEVAVTDGPDFSCKPVQLVLTERLEDEVRREVLAGIDKMKFLELDIKVIDCDLGMLITVCSTCKLIYLTMYLFLNFVFAINL